MKCKKMSIFFLLVLLFLSLSFSNSVIAGGFPHHIFNGNFSQLSISSGGTVNWWVASNGPVSQSLNAASQWGGIGNKINFNRHFTLTPATMLQVSYGPLPLGVTGAAVMFDTNNNTINPNSIMHGTNFVKVLITIDNNQISSWSSAERNFLLGHEFGHALSLGHFEDSPSPHSGNHWMRSGKRAMNFPSSTDIQHFNMKW